MLDLVEGGVGMGGGSNGKQGTQAGQGKGNAKEHGKSRKKGNRPPVLRHVEEKQGREASAAAAGRFSE
ncbi:hypothetical protein CTTA_4510 [Comamonas testosteroni]|uniref:Uncharacterized protein n=1 Tax=Comamonas testosteroni TaxID=285 RepID=A0A5A7MLD8_COMTE|nr:hypothetical protein CTTA_4510 [Comamonas testosteroni]